MSLYRDRYEDIKEKYDLMASHLALLLDCKKEDIDKLYDTNIRYWNIGWMIKDNVKMVHKMPNLKQMYDKVYYEILNRHHLYGGKEVELRYDKDFNIHIYLKKDLYKYMYIVEDFENTFNVKCEYLEDLNNK